MNTSNRKTVHYQSYIRDVAEDPNLGTYSDWGLSGVWLLINIFHIIIIIMDFILFVTGVVASTCFSLCIYLLLVLCGISGKYSTYQNQNSGCVRICTLILSNVISCSRKVDPTHIVFNLRM